MREALRRFRNHGISSDARQRQAEGSGTTKWCLLGFNYRLTDIACALGLSQLKKLEANLLRRREIAARYEAAFRDVAGILPPAVRADVNPAWHLYPIRLNLEKLTADRGADFPGVACREHRGQRSLHSRASPSLLSRSLWTSGRRVSDRGRCLRAADQPADVSRNERRRCGGCDPSGGQSRESLRCLRATSGF